MYISLLEGSQCRVRPEASAIAKQQSQGTIARLLQEGGDFPPPSHRKCKLILVLFSMKTLSLIGST